MLAGLPLIGCTNIECPLDNQVLATLTFWDANTQSTTKVGLELSVYGLKNKREELLFNQGTDLSEIQIPLNPTTKTDTLLFKFTNGTQVAVDTLFVNHTPFQHFESLDCPACTFHTLTQVHHTDHLTTFVPLTIDSVAIISPNVHYEDVENLQVFLRSTDQ